VITHLPPVIAPRSALRDQPSDDHPMRKVTRQVAFDPDGWTPERAAKVADLFDSLAPEWDTRDVPDREDPLRDALRRGDVGVGRALEVGSGTGIATRRLADQFDFVVAVDLSFPMLALAPRDRGGRVQADASRLPLPASSFDAVALQNALLFPREVDRVLRPEGVIVWVSSVGPLTPIYLSAEEVADALPGSWVGTASVAGEGTWCVLRRFVS
jgi:SAM-dependent methyltransferase